MGLLKIFIHRGLNRDMNVLNLMHRSYSHVAVRISIKKNAGIILFHLFLKLNDIEQCRDLKFLVSDIQKKK